MSKVKVWLTCPKENSNSLRVAIGDAGIGKIGNYSHCSFVTEGKGYFKPAAGADPTIGSVGKLEEVNEVVIEFVCEESQLPKLRQILDDIHPYEEVAVDVFPLLDF